MITQGSCAAWFPLIQEEKTLFFFLKGLAWLAVFYFGWQVIG